MLRAHEMGTEDELHWFFALQTQRSLQLQGLLGTPSTCTRIVLSVTPRATLLPSNSRRFSVPWPSSISLSFRSMMLSLQVKCPLYCSIWTTQKRMQPAVRRRPKKHYTVWYQSRDLIYCSSLAQQKFRWMVSTFLQQRWNSMIFKDSLSFLISTLIIFLIQKLLCVLRVCPGTSFNGRVCYIKRYPLWHHPYMPDEICKFWGYCVKFGMLLIWNTVPQSSILVTRARWHKPHPKFLLRGVHIKSDEPVNPLGLFWSSWPMA